MSHRKNSVKVKFWGVRGSVPAPLTPAQVTAKVRRALELSKQGLPVPFSVESTYGGNTTCVEIVAGSQQFICDMGTGVRELGKAQMPEAFRTKKLRGTILQSHVHWDHIQGIPFWAPMYLPRRQFDCSYKFFGGKAWDSQIDAVYRGQMNAPVFPVNLGELEATAMRMEFETIFDGWAEDFIVPGENMDGGPYVDDERAEVLARKLFHPQETFGYRITHNGVSVAFTTDHEPYAGGANPKPLLELVSGVDLWITDCQYTHDDFVGKAGPQKMGWGHSYPGYIAQVAKEAKPKRVITTHHDPDSDDEKVEIIARMVADDSGVDTVAAYEGLEISL